jgi:hypothetical protein
VGIAPRSRAVEDTLQDAAHVRVEDGRAPAIGERQYGAGGVGADALEAEQRVATVGNAAVPLRDDLARHGVEAHRANVVT